MSMSSQLSNASTPPRRPARSPTSFASASRVDALYDRLPQVSFTDSARSEEADESAYASYSPLPRHQREGISTPCWSCRQTQRLRTSLKRIELDYLTQIQSLQQQLRHVTAQRALALQERDELLTNADAAATQQAMVEQEAQSLRVEVMQAVQERHELERRVQQLETSCQSTVEQHVRWGSALLEETEVAARRDSRASEENERRLLHELCSTEARAIKEMLRPSTVVATPPRCNAASGTAVNGSTILSSTFSPTGTSSPGLSDGGRERRSCSPRPSQRREVAAPHHTQRPSTCGDASRIGLESATDVSRALALSHTAEEAEEKVRKMEWRMEQQRSSFEMQLADERALTADMQAEMDDLIESELMLLESEGRRTIEKDAAEARTALFTHHISIFVRQHQQEAASITATAMQTAAAAATATATESTHADVLDLVEESENAAWRTEMSEAMSNVQQQLYQLLCAAPPSRMNLESARNKEVIDCVREEAAEIKEHLAALLDASAQARVDGDALRTEMKEHFDEVGERQCRQEAFMVTTSCSPAQRNEAPALLLEQLRKELEPQRELSERLCEMLQRASHTTVSAGATAAESESSSKERTSTSLRPSSHHRASESTGRLGGNPLGMVTPRKKAKHRDPAADMMAPAEHIPAAVPVSSDNQPRQQPPSATACHSCDDQLSTMTTVSESTVEQDASLLQRKSCTSDSRFIVPEEALFDPQHIHVDASAAAEQISALLSEGSLSDAESDCLSPYDEY
ncbi:hypothetical protein ABB37_05264 [Leptomonas pyrrhocoris]|uniref:Uncharacterized protein n=1 Tax=Leptomonas pyrrhocoris TaxID=157538 RepID=A0A0M9FZY7_LEPPY|nr:hypothetical protein ABB37_05264 [Leptomonas pyrrhocoris]XP_015657862.1 hypothetical protein ABB37_05264 [Leptomonas pyrrhocoris]KPA79422.1 hypothetical protein ABB37_05264 [Leptomonas pyrrhocoris]KPA79423.1 hypothetical protein ABB37_05264 [Leptomonas pyrrhocoris]|eukprot:XP_015657861.1 hypothetical protein ABB37_05264 [Leptomonas pyrrhocoris]